MSVPARKLIELGGTAPETPHRVTAQPLTSGPRRTRFDLYFVFTNYNHNEVYAMVYKSEVRDGDRTSLTPTSSPRLVKIAMFTEKMLRTMSVGELIVIKNESVEARLAQQQAKKIMDNIIFTYGIEEAANRKDKIEAPDGRLKPEFVDALFRKELEPLNEMLK